MRPWHGVDHLMLRLDRLEPMHDFLTGAPGLPVTWPVCHEAFADYAWVGLGNTELELWAARRNKDLPTGARLPVVHGFALAPRDLAHSMAALAAIDVRCATPRSWRTPGTDGRDVTNFTNALLPDFCGPSCCVFFCDWATDAPIAPWTQEAQDRAARRDALWTRAAGGLLGLVGLAEIVLSAPDRLA